VGVLLLWTIGLRNTFFFCGLVAPAPRAETKQKNLKNKSMAKMAKPAVRKAKEMIAAVLGRDWKAPAPKCRVVTAYTGGGNSQGKWVPEAKS